MKKIKINFVDFWPSFHKKDNYFYHLLSQEYDVILDEENPDIVIGSYGFNSEKEILRYQNHKCLKIYYTGESDGPKNNFYDINMTQHRTEDESNFRLPLWAFFISWFNEQPIIHHRDPSYLVPWNSLQKNKNVDLEAVVNSKSKFCSFIYADLTSERKKWFDIISSVNKVDSAGSCLNNTGIKIPGRGDQIYKITFLSDYFFSISVENCCVNGYATEKLLHPMAALTIPLYWGDPHVDLDVNIESIIDLRKSSTDVIEELRQIMSSKKSYLDKLEKPWFSVDHSTRYKKDALKFIVNSLNKKLHSK